MPDAAQSVALRIEDAGGRAREISNGPGLPGSDLGGFFQVGHQHRAFRRLRTFEKCNFFDLHFSLYFGSTATQLGPAHPGLFGDLFPELLQRLAGGATTLTLLIRDVSSDFFDEFSVIQSELLRKGLRFALLSHLEPSLYEDRRPGNLFFEWPVEDLRDVVDKWFMVPQVTIEGYVSKQPILGLLSMLYVQADTERRIMQLLRSLEFGFRLWRDLNGLWVLSDKVNRSELERRLRLDELNALVQQRARAH
jgi:hypothetical protein